MEWLNYNHLLYFWTVAREGGLVAAGKVLHLSHSTLSAQIRALEERLGQKLFTKIGRKLALTDTGKVVYRYANEIFSKGNEMLDTVRGRAAGQEHRLEVGIADSVPKLIVKRLLDPALEPMLNTKLICREDRFDQLLADLSLHNLDIVIADAPVPPGSRVKAFNHLLGQCGVGVFAKTKLANKLSKNFPRSLNDAPFLLPLETLPLRRALDHWFSSHQVRPRIVAEFEDSALLKVFGGDGLGVFPAPLAVTREICAHYGVRLLGELHGVTEQFYAISVERQLQHPAILAITQSARHTLGVATHSRKSARAR